MVVLISLASSIWSVGALRYNDGMKNAVSLVTTLLIFAAIIAVVAWRWRRKKQLRERYDLQKGQRAVSIYQQWLDPVVALLVVGGLLWQDLLAGPGHIVVLVIGAAIGAGIGIARARLMYVSAVRQHGHLIVQRGKVEIGLLIALVVLKIYAHTLADTPNSVANLLVTGLLGADIAESTARVAYLTHKMLLTKSRTQSKTDVERA